MKKVLLFLAVPVLLMAQGQKPAPFTADEKLALKNAQIEYLTAQAQFQAAQANFQAAQQNLTKAIGEVYSSRKIQQTEWTICDGESGPACQGVKKGDLEWRAAPKEPKK